MGAAPTLPRLSVLLPVYNGERFIAQSVRSVLAQTFRDFELVVVDDGSADRTLEIVSGFQDPRIRLVRLPEHKGLVEALNVGLRSIESELVARMDADDDCLPGRFERQVRFLDAHPDVALCGSWTQQFGNGASAISRPPASPHEVHARLFFGWSIDHPSVMMRRDFLALHGLEYDEAFRHVEDQDFFMRVAEVGKIANIPEVLLRTREHEANVSRVYRQEQVRTEKALYVRQLQALLPDATEEQTQFHVRIATESVGLHELGRADQWLLQLDAVNRTLGRYHPEAFRDELRQRSYDLHAGLVTGGLAVFRAFWHSPVAGSLGNRLLGIAALAREWSVARLVVHKRSLLRMMARR